MIANGSHRSRRAALSLLAVTNLIAGCASARVPPQTVSSPRTVAALRPGDQVRLRVAGDSMRHVRYGTVVAVDLDSLRLRRSDMASAPTEAHALWAVHSLESRRGKASPLAYCATGALATSVVAGVAASTSANRDVSDYAILIGPIIGVLYGCPGGFLLGLLSGSYGGWQAIALPGNVVPPTLTRAAYPGEAVRMVRGSEHLDGRVQRWSGDSIVLLQRETPVAIPWSQVDRLYVRSPSPGRAFLVGGAAGMVLPITVRGNMTASQGFLAGAALATLVEWVHPSFSLRYRRPGSP